MELQRLDKIIAAQLNISRKEVKSGIRNGKAEINGTAVFNADYQINPEKDSIVYDGQAVIYKEFVYIVMNKPAGVLSASSDKSRETVIDLVPAALKRKGLFPVGRLDKDTTGLLIITDDGDFAHRVLTPKNEVYKTYIAGLDGEVTEQTVKDFLNGIVLADGTQCRKAYLKPLEGNRAEIKICEGKYHQIKRMFGAAGLGVNSLERRAIGGYELPDFLAPGECTEVTKYQLNPLFIAK